MHRPPFSLLLFAFLFLGCSSADSEAQDAPTATYTVTFQATWGPATFPDGFPSNPHFSGLVGAVHNDGVVFWAEGALASRGIEVMAETGSKTNLLSEVAAASANAEALSGGGISRSPGSAMLTFSVTPDRPLVTLVSMLAPSPDWFVGVAGLNLYEGGTWVETQTVDLILYDAGTDSGVTYQASNVNTDPADPITRMSEVTYTNPFSSDDIVGRFVFSLVEAVGTEADFEVPATPFEVLAAYPNPFQTFATVPVLTTRAGPVLAELFDLQGRRLRTVFDGWLPSGTSEILRIDAAGLSAGTYIVRVAGGGAVRSRPLFIIP